jgi:hypothetical protein
MAGLDTVINALNNTGASLFGLAMPVMSPSWTKGGAMPTVGGDFVLRLDPTLPEAGNTWLAPASGTLRAIEDSFVGVTLIGANGIPVNGPGLLLTLGVQLHLRLARLYAQVLETSVATRPERDRGQPFRPVPRYFFFAGAVTSADKDGNVNCGDEIGQLGDLTIFDDNGMIIDPLAVAAAWDAIMTAHHPLQHRSVSSPFDTNPQIKQIAALAGTTSSVRVRLCDHAGRPETATHLEGLIAVNATTGVFTLKASTGTGSDLTGKITKAAVSTAFPAEVRRLILIGPGTTGRLTDEFSPPALPSGVTLRRDFFNVRLLRLSPFLLGEPDVDFIGAKLEQRPAIRINEALTLLADGNDVLASVDTALAGTTQESLVVAPQIADDFAAPSAIGSAAHWPAFPALPSGTTAAPAGALPIALRDSFNATASFLDDGNGSTANVDVVLTLNSLPVGAAVRIFPRKMVEDAREARGDGAGGTVPASGTLVLRLKDPFALRRPGIPDSGTLVPSEATLRVDVIVVKRTGESRIYGNVSARISGAQTTAVPPVAGTNRFSTANRRGVSNAGILGLPAPALSSLPDDTLEAALALASEGTPRDAPRLPMMARRELLAAGLVTPNWRAALAAGRLTAEAHSADQRIGAPGSPGGRETQLAGVATQNGRLAFDIARAAFRRTTNIVSRITDLADDTWNEPAQPPALAIGAAPNATSGTFAGAVLQTISPLCETPEFGLARSFVEAHADDIPRDFNGLIDFVIARVNSLVPAGSFRTQIVNALNGLKNNSALDEAARERVFNELHRELMSSCFGRRDAQWALAGAIKQARRFIYIETPGFGPTRKPTYTNDSGTTIDPPPYALDLIDLIRQRLDVATGLRVIIGTPKVTDFAAGYEPMGDNEATNRRTRILELDDSRVVSFHPVGFPGRPTRLESTVVIVDDVWALVGSSTFRRRGLTFDGGGDLVFTDVELVNGRSPAIATFRRQLMALRLGIKAADTNDSGTMPTANFTRLSDGAESFNVVREMLVAGGLGKIERLWNGELPGVTRPQGGSFDLTSPEGLEYDLAGALAISALAGLNAF